MFVHPAGSRRAVALVVVGLVGGFFPQLGLSQPAPFFEDDFEEYFNDEELQDLGGWQIMEVNQPVEISAIWTLLNNGGRANPPTEDGTPSVNLDGTPSSQFLISDSDCCGGESDGQGSGRSHDIWSPVIEVAGDVIWLHMDCSAQLNNNGTVIFDIDVSTDEGATWTNVFRRIAPSRTVDPLPTPENSSGFFGRLHVDLSSVAANQNEIMFRLRQFEPDWDWWVAVDNVVVDDQPGLQG
ncbi:MAG: hypothetical protein O7J95_01165, partial [Planctomycetota bacterium]|nr:hypothetical protein [Planctomycetota bacterium]